MRRAAENKAVSVKDQTESIEFPAEVRKVLDIFVNSPYSNEDAFLRELVTNAADACTKKRFLALTEGDAPPEAMNVRISADKDKRTLTIEDNGVGLQMGELIASLGRIARSGMTNFVKAGDGSLIG
eukprot:11136701-Heterocapsa_arctica.AAC.1